MIIYRKSIYQNISFGERYILPIISVFQIVLRGKQENTLSKGIGNFAGRIILLSGGNLTRSDFVSSRRDEPLMRWDKNLVGGGYSKSLLLFCICMGKTVYKHCFI